MDNHLINKYLEGNASETETKEVFAWISESPENHKEFIQSKKAWALAARAQEDQEKAWNNTLTKKIHTRQNTRRWLQFTSYAAAVIFAAGLGMALQWVVSTRSVDSLVYSAETTVEVPYGQMTNIVLPDGTIVNLNSGSRLSYSSGYGSGKRVVALQGEAFFHVTTDKEHPFLIKTNKLDFRVYGTSFNVEAYPEDDFLNTTLVEGSLGVLSKNGKEHTRLKPGENFQYLENEKKMEVKKVDITTYTSWKDGLVTFRNESLENIARKIERWYNVEIVIKNSRLKEELYLGTIMKNKPVDQILEVLHLTSSLNYTTIVRPDQPTLIYWE